MSAEANLPNRARLANAANICAAYGCNEVPAYGTANGVRYCGAHGPEGRCDPDDPLPCERCGGGWVHVSRSESSFGEANLQACGRCGADPAQGQAMIDGKRYCHAGVDPTCYMLETWELAGKPQSSLSNCPDCKLDHNITCTKHSDLATRVRFISGLDDATLKRLGGIGSEPQVPVITHATQHEDVSQYDGLPGESYPMPAQRLSVSERIAAHEKRLAEMYEPDRNTEPQVARPCDDDAPCGRGGCVACIPDRIEQSPNDERLACVDCPDGLMCCQNETKNCPRTGQPCDICNDNGRAACAEPRTETVKRDEDISRYCIECERLTHERHALQDEVNRLEIAAQDREREVERMSQVLWDIARMNRKPRPDGTFNYDRNALIDLARAAINDCKGFTA